MDENSPDAPMLNDCLRAPAETTEVRQADTVDPRGATSFPASPDQSRNKKQNGCVIIQTLLQGTIERAEATARIEELRIFTKRCSSATLEFETYTTSPSRI